MKRKFFKISAILFIAYLAAAMVTFDFSQNAYPLDEEYYPNGRIRVLGPKPRSPLCRAALADIHYHGSEWPFLVFNPICQIWRAKERHMAPRNGPAR